MCSSPKFSTQAVLTLANRRGGDRVAVQTSLPCHQEGGLAANAHAINVSETGARLILPGGHIDFRHRLTLQVGEHEIRARVVWEQPMVVGKCRVAGVRFENLSAEQAAALRQLAA